MKKNLFFLLFLAFSHETCLKAGKENANFNRQLEKSNGQNSFWSQNDSQKEQDVSMDSLDKDPYPYKYAPMTKGYYGLSPKDEKDEASHYDKNQFKSDEALRLSIISNNSSSFLKESILCFEDKIPEKSFFNKNKNKKSKNKEEIYTEPRVTKKAFNIYDDRNLLQYSHSNYKAPKQEFSLGYQQEINMGAPEKKFPSNYQQDIDMEVQGGAALILNDDSTKEIYYSDDVQMSNKVDFDNQTKSCERIDSYDNQQANSYNFYESSSFQPKKEQKITPEQHQKSVVEQKTFQGLNKKKHEKRSMFSWEKESSETKKTNKQEEFYVSGVHNDASAFLENKENFTILDHDEHQQINDCYILEAKIEEIKNECFEIDMKACEILRQYDEKLEKIISITNDTESKKFKKTFYLMNIRLSQYLRELEVRKEKKMKILKNLEQKKLKYDFDYNQELINSFQSQNFDYLDSDLERAIEESKKTALQQTAENFREKSLQEQEEELIRKAIEESQKTFNQAQQKEQIQDFSHEIFQSENTEDQSTEDSSKKSQDPQKSKKLNFRDAFFQNYIQSPSTKNLKKIVEKCTNDQSFSNGVYFLNNEIKEDLLSIVKKMDNKTVHGMLLNIFEEKQENIIVLKSICGKIKYDLLNSQDKLKNQTQKEYRKYLFIDMIDQNFTQYMNQKFINNAEKVFDILDIMGQEEFNRKMQNKELSKKYAISDDVLNIFSIFLKEYDHLHQNKIFSNFTKKQYNDYKILSHVLFLMDESFSHDQKNLEYSFKIEQKEQITSEERKNYYLKDLQKIKNLQKNLINEREGLFLSVDSFTFQNDTLFRQTVEEIDLKLSLLSLKEKYLTRIINCFWVKDYIIFNLLEEKKEEKNFLKEKQVFIKEKRNNNSQKIMASTENELKKYQEEARELKSQEKSIKGKLLLLEQEIFSLKYLQSQKYNEENLFLHMMEKFGETQEMQDMMLKISDIYGKILEQREVLKPYISEKTFIPLLDYTEGKIFIQSSSDKKKDGVYTSFEDILGTMYSKQKEILGMLKNEKDKNLLGKYLWEIFSYLAFQDYKN